MDFKEKNKGFKRAGVYTAFIAFYLVFTTILFFLLKITHKIPESWGYLNVMVITCAILIVGKTIEWSLK